MPVRFFSPTLLLWTTVYYKKNSFLKKKNKRGTFFLLEIKTIRTYVKTYFLDYNWTKFGNKNYCTKHYIL